MIGMRHAGGMLGVVAGVAVMAAAAVGAEIRLTGAGATFPAPLYKKWVVEFEKAPGGKDVQIDYNSIGSGGGVKAITDKTVAFGASDAPLSKKELAALGGAEKVVLVPSCAGGVVPAYNLPGVKGEIKFTGDVLARVFMGKIGKWNDKAIADLNPGRMLPDMAITPAYRSDGSGTTFVWTNYLATQSEEFKGSVGMGKQVQWPTGQGGKGNEGVAAIVQQTPGALGYVEANFANANKISYGSVKNQAGKFVKATVESISAAGAGAVGHLKGTVLSTDIWNQPGDASYPIAAFTYLIVYKDLNNLKSAEEAKALVAFMDWATTGGQSTAREMDYAPLAPDVQKKVAEALATLTYQGKPVK
ncbi:MAG TPA: phosphate ABC transporter substrate-binding protein PstS [Phycisphaerales bacterium]|mgnify:CR=1 FL=1|nr:phosphate ABC transporter substrate-binding protein PstS [Phycisphaerales bacterium]